MDSNRFDKINEPIFLDSATELTITSAKAGRRKPDQEGYAKYKGEGKLKLTFGAASQQIGFQDVEIPGGDAEAKSVEVTFEYNDSEKTFRVIEMFWQAYDMDMASKWYSSDYYGPDISGKILASGSDAMFLNHSDEVEVRLTAVKLKATALPEVSDSGQQAFRLEGKNDVHFMLQESLSIGKDGQLEARLAEGLHGDLYWIYAESHFLFALYDFQIEYLGSGLNIETPVVDKEGNISGWGEDGSPVHSEKFCIESGGLKMETAAHISKLIGSFRVQKND